MGGIFGGGGGGAVAPPPASSAETSLTTESSKEIAMGRPVRESAINLAQLGLHTGAAPDVAIPEIQKNIESILSAASLSKQNTTDLTSRLGLDRTPYALNTLSNLDLQSMLAVAGVPSAMNESIINRGLTASGVGTQIGFQGLGSASQNATQRGVAGTQASGQVTSSLFGSLGALGLGIGMAAAGGGGVGGGSGGGKAGGGDGGVE